VVVRVQDPDDDPGEPEENDDREEHTGEADREVDVASRVAEGAHEKRREQDEDRSHAAEAEQRQPEERRRHPPRPRLLAPFQQLAEHRHECAGERGVGHESPDEVRDLDRDGERVDLPGDAEVVGADHLANEPEGAGDGGGEREHRRRASDAAAMAGLVDFQA
jgi:hypothetical protein